jgi:hypothetical protein
VQALPDCERVGYGEKMGAGTRVNPGNTKIYPAVRNNASHRVIWCFSLGNTWHELAAPLWVLSAAIPIRGAAFPRNARHARTLPALHYARAFPRLKRPIAPAIQKHPSTVHQAL